MGKTTLLTRIHDRFVETSSMFETLIWTVASSEQSDVSRVQSEIVRMHRLKEDNDVQSQADLINNFLENKNFLLFIDDLWKDVDLHKVGVPNIPNGGNPSGKKRKVIFTTRRREVCGNMKARKIIEVKCTPTQSLILFTEKVELDVIQSHPRMPKLVEDIAKECQGLPLALITIGRAMSTKLNIDDWKHALNLLKDSQGLHDLDVDEQLLFVLKISYDYLTTDQLRKCFISISMWPEDYMSSNKIVDLPMELKNLKELRYLILTYNCITNISTGVFFELADLLVVDMFKAIDIWKYPSVNVEELKSIEKKLLCFGTTVGSKEELNKLMLLSELPIDDLCMVDLRGTTFHFMAMIRNAHRLKELYIYHCFGGLLEIVFDKMETDQDIASLNLEILGLFDLDKLKMIIWKDIAPEILFVELREVVIEDCPRLEDITWVIHLPSLKCLAIRRCDGMRIAVNNEVDSQVLTFPSLEKFCLQGVNKLEKNICPFSC